MGSRDRWTNKFRSRREKKMPWGHCDGSMHFWKTTKPAIQSNKTIEHEHAPCRTPKRNKQASSSFVPYRLGPCQAVSENVVESQENGTSCFHVNPHLPNDVRPQLTVKLEDTVSRMARSLFAGFRKFREQKTERDDQQRRSRIFAKCAICHFQIPKNRRKIRVPLRITLEERRVPKISSVSLFQYHLCT